MRSEIRVVLWGTQTLTFCAAALIFAGAAWAQNDAGNQAEETRQPPSAGLNEDAPPKAEDEARARDSDRRQPDARDAEDPSADRRRASEADQRDPSDERSTDRAAPAGQRGDRRSARPDDSRGDPRDERQGESSRPKGLGLQIEEEGEEGLTVTDVQQGSVAAQAGLRANDRIISADGRQFSDARQLRAYLGGQFGRRVPVIIERNGRQYTVQLSPSIDDEGAWLGVYMEDGEDDQAGARVTHVFPTSPAARAGFRAGDVILEVNGQSVESSPDVIAMVEESEPGSEAEFRVRRNQEEVDLTATLGRRDAYVFFSRDSRDRSPNGQGQERGRDDDDPLSSLPPYLMRLEHDRRMAEQHQRMEEAIHQLREEVKQLREEITKQR